MAAGLVTSSSPLRGLTFWETISRPLLDSSESSQGENTSLSEANWIRPLEPLGRWSLPDSTPRLMALLMFVFERESLIFTNLTFIAEITKIGELDEKDSLCDLVLIVEISACNDDCSRLARVFQF